MALLQQARSLFFSIAIPNKVRPFESIRRHSPLLLHYRPLSINLPNTIRSFRRCRPLQRPSSSTGQAMDDLASKKCVPCNSKDIRPMSEQSALELLPKVEGWDIVNENETLKLRKSWKVKSFMKGLEFFRCVADLAEAEGHHPDLHLVGWNNVNIDIWTHSIGGLTENDFILAKKIDLLDLEELLRHKVPRER